MKTLTEVRHIEKYLLGELGPASRLVFEARLLIDPALRTQVDCQRKLQSIVTHYGRRTIKSEVERLHRELFSDIRKEKFQQEVYQIFTKQ
jgi:hypothetical protein